MANKENRNELIGGVLVGLAIMTITTMVMVTALVNPPGHSHDVENPQPTVVMEVLDETLEPYAPLWKAEISRRFNNAVGVLVHGGDFVEGQWIIGRSLSPYHISTAKDIVEHYQKLYPGRTIVLLACNTGHLSLGIPNVYYAKSSVWCVPDRALTPDMLTEADKLLDGGASSRWAADSDVVGNIYEMVKD